VGCISLKLGAIAFHAAEQKIINGVRNVRVQQHVLNAKQDME